MRILIAAAAIVLVTGPADTQEMGTGKRHQQSTQNTSDKTKIKADEKAYKDALKRIPVSNEKPDPWKAMR